MITTEYNKKLSIITVCYNNKEGLRKTMESVKRQTFTNYEHIIIDGGSTDGTVELIKENEEYIDYWISEKDSGIYSAMNKGIKVAKGEYCYFLNSDDCIAAPNTLEKIFEKVNGADIIYGNLAISRNNKVFRVGKFKKNIRFVDTYCNGSFIQHQASFIKRELFNKYGLYHEDVKAISDWIFYYETVALKGVGTQYINRVFSVFEKAGLSLQVNEKNIREVILESTVPLLLRTELDRLKQRKYSIFDKIVSRLLLVVCKIKGEVSL